MGTDAPAPLEAHCKVWIEVGGRVALSDWRVELLEKIQECGSLAEAARQMDVPYRTAWYKLKEIEGRLGFKLLETHTGGAARGSATLTAEALDVVRQYHDVADGIHELVQERFASSFSR